MLEWSKTVKKRTQSRPAEQNGDFDDQVNPPFLLMAITLHPPKPRVVQL